MEVELNLNANSYQRDLAITISNTEKGARRLESANRELGDSFSDADKKAKQFIDRERSLNSNSKKLADSFSAVAGALAAWKGFSYLQGMSVELDAIGKASRNLDITAEQLQGLRYAAKSANFDAGKLESVFGRIQNVIGGAKSGDEGEVKKLRAIGLELDDLQGKNAYQTFEQIANAVMSIKDPAERTRAGIALFGKEFVKMSEFLRTFASSAEAAKASGMIFSNEAIANAEKYQQILTDLDTSVKALIANSQGVKNLAGWLSEIRSGATNDSAANAVGMKTRKQAIDEAINTAEKSDRYSPEEIEKMRSVSGSYAKRTSEFWIGRRYKGAYTNIDKALTEAGYGDIARVNGKHSGGDYVMRKKSQEEIKADLANARKKKEAEEQNEFDRGLRKLANGGDGSTSAKDPEEEKDEASRKYFEKQLEKMKEEEKYMELLLAGKKKEAELQKWIAEYKQIGVLSDRDAEKLARRRMEIEEKRKEVDAEKKEKKAAEYLQKQADALSPKDKKATEIERMTRDMKNIIGGDVPAEMAKQIEKIAELKAQMEDKPKFAEIPTSTNSLIERGGMRLNHLPDAAAQLQSRMDKINEKNSAITNLKAGINRMIQKQSQAADSLAVIAAIYKEN